MGVQVPFPVPVFNPCSTLIVIGLLVLSEHMHSCAWLLLGNCLVGHA